MASRQTLYERVADRVEGLISDGTLRPGDRIPSVRKLHGQWSVSVSTVLEAYRLLEDRGLVEARPKSGYFVRLNPRQLLQEPAMSNPPTEAREVRADVSFRMMAETLDPTIVKLGAATPDPEFLPVRTLSRLLGEVCRKKPHVAHGYAMGNGLEPLRRQIARRMVDAGSAIGPDEVVVTSGAQEAVYLALRALTQPGDTVAVESPTYYGLLETLEALHLRALPIRTHARDGIDLDALGDALRDGGIRAVSLVANFGNPLGSLMPDDKKKALVDLVSHHDVPLVEDDVYGELPFEGPRPRSLFSFDQTDHVLYCSSFSKTMSPGFRVGWCVAGVKQSSVARLKLVTTVASASAPQLAVAAYLEEGGYDRHLRRLRRIYRENVTRMSAAVSQHFPPGTRATRPAGGHVLWAEMPRHISSLALYDRAREHRISLTPGTIFSASGRYEHCLRLNCALPWSERVADAVATLGRLAGEQ